MTPSESTKLSDQLGTRVNLTAPETTRKLKKYNIRCNHATYFNFKYQQKIGILFIEFKLDDENVTMGWQHACFVAFQAKIATQREQITIRSFKMESEYLFKYVTM